MMFLPNVVSRFFPHQDGQDRDEEKIWMGGSVHCNIRKIDSGTESLQHFASGAGFRLLGQNITLSTMFENQVTEHKTLLFAKCNQEFTRGTQMKMNAIEIVFAISHQSREAKISFEMGIDPNLGAEIGINQRVVNILANQTCFLHGCKGLSIPQSIEDLIVFIAAFRKLTHEAADNYEQPPVPEEKGELGLLKSLTIGLQNSISEGLIIADTEITKLNEQSTALLKRIKKLEIDASIVNPSLDDLGQDVPYDFVNTYHNYDFQPFTLSKSISGDYELTKKWSVNIIGNIHNWNPFHVHMSSIQKLSLTGVIGGRARVEFTNIETLDIYPVMSLNIWGRIDGLSSVLFENIKIVRIRGRIDGWGSHVTFRNCGIVLVDHRVDGFASVEFIHCKSVEVGDRVDGFAHVVCTRCEKVEVVNKVGPFAKLEISNCGPVKVGGKAWP